MAEPRTLHLQRALAALVLDVEPPAGDAFDGGREALLAYRELVREGLGDAVETMFPVTRALLEEAGAWDGCLAGFMAARCVASRHYRDLAPAFLGWLAQTRWGEERWPFLLELAHAELLESLVHRAEDLPAPQGLASVPIPSAQVVLDAAAQVVSYRHAVHRCTEAAPRPEAAATHLLAFRDPEGRFQLRELTPFAAALLVDPRPLGEALAAMGEPDPAQAFPLLEELRNAGAIAGFRANLTGT